MAEGSRRWPYRTIRDAVITTVALGGLVHEVVLAEQVRPELLLLIGSLLAVPAFLRADEHLRRRDQDADDEDNAP